MNDEVAQAPKPIPHIICPLCKGTGEYVCMLVQHIEPPKSEKCWMCGGLGLWRVVAEELLPKEDQ